MKTNQEKFRINKDYKYWNIFSELIDWRIITFKTSKISNNELIFVTTLKGVGCRMREKILIFMYWTMRINDDNTDSCLKKLKTLFYSILKHEIIIAQQKFGSLLVGV